MNSTVVTVRFTGKDVPRINKFRKFCQENSMNMRNIIRKVIFKEAKRLYYNEAIIENRRKIKEDKWAVKF